MENIIVAFHIGRGGKFSNPGFKTYVADIKSKMDVYNEKFTLVSEDEDGNKIPEADWKMYDGGGNIIDEGKDSIFATTGTIDIDGEYDSWIICDIEDCDERELEIIKEYARFNYIDREVETYINNHY